MTAQIPELPMIPSVMIETVYHLPPEILYEPLLQEAAEYHGVDPDLVRAVVRTESAFDATAVSAAGAQGLMQLMPALSDELGVKDPSTRARTSLRACGTCGRCWISTTATKRWPWRATTPAQAP
jgi:hypothetical protein